MRKAAVNRMLSGAGGSIPSYPTGRGCRRKERLGGPARQRYALRMTLNWRLVLLVAAIVLFCLYGFEVVPEDQTVFLGVGLGCLAASFLPV